MFDGSWGNFPGFLYAPVFFNGTDDQDEFLSLPEDAQKLLLKKGADSSEDLHQQIEEFKLKQ